MNRREFVTMSAALGVSAAAGAAPQVSQASLPAAVGSANGLRSVEKAVELLRQDVDTLDAVIAGVNLIEEDEEDVGVGYGGLPNEDGVVQLDASVMHGPTRGAGAVAALEGIMYPSRVAKRVMEYTDHVLLVGDDALRFALAMGFEKQNLLTERAREAWLQWKRELNPGDKWIHPKDRLPASGNSQSGKIGRLIETAGTVHCSIINARGDISGVTSTSGLSYKIPGRVGDSPIIGAGLYVDNDVGACGSTGRGEANLKTCACFLGVEFMRAGLRPEEAGMRVLRRIVENTVEPYLLDEKGRPNFGLQFYLLNKKGEFAGVSMWSGRQYAAHDGRAARLYEAAYLYRKEDESLE